MLNNVFEISVRTNGLQRSVFLASESRNIPAKREVFAALQNQIDFYVERGIDEADLEDELFLLGAINSTEKWFSSLDNKNLAMFISSDRHSSDKGFMFICALHLVWHQNKCLDSVTQSEYIGSHGERNAHRN